MPWSAVEPYAVREQPTCDPKEKPGVQRFRSLVLDAKGGTDLGIVRLCDNGVATSLHNEGRAWDWGPVDRSFQSMAKWQRDVESVLGFLLASDDDEPEAFARRAGLQTIIYRNRIWIAGKGWQDYYGADPHVTHVHFGFSRAGASGATSLYTHQWGTADALPFRDVAPPHDRVGAGDTEPAPPSPPPPHVEGSTPPDPPDTLPDMGQQLLKMLTPLTAEDLAKVLATAHIRVFGRAPTQNRLSLAWAQVNHETAETTAAGHYNWGNIKAFNWTGDYFLQDDDAPNERFRAYPDAIAGAVGFWSLLKGRYGAALAAADEGDPAAYAAALKRKGYFTAGLESYTKRIAFYQARFWETFTRDSWARRLAPLVAVAVLAGAAGALS